MKTSSARASTAFGVSGAPGAATVTIVTVVTVGLCSSLASKPLEVSPKYSRSIRYFLVSVCLSVLCSFHTYHSFHDLEHDYL